MPLLGVRSVYGNFVPRYSLLYSHISHTPKAVTYHEPTVMIGHITVGS